MSRTRKLAAALGGLDAGVRLHLAVGGVSMGRVAGEGFELRPSGYEADLPCFSTLLINNLRRLPICKSIDPQAQ
jgi:hypothetical protein